MVKRFYVPGNGEIVWLTFNPQAGHRPAVTLSPRSYNRKTGLALFWSITSRAKGYPFEIVLPPSSPVTGVILSDRIKSQDCRDRRVSLESKAAPLVASILPGNRGSGDRTENSNV